jgi:N-sulfoglucosamine sulfohydrolase
MRHGILGSNNLNNRYLRNRVFARTERPRVCNLVRRYLSRPAEDSYHTTVDRFEMNNLGSDPKFADVKARLCVELYRWLPGQGGSEGRRSTATSAAGGQGWRA